MSVTRVLDRARRTAESLMLDACTVSRPGEAVTDDEGDVTVPSTGVYSGRCKVQTYEAFESTSEAGGRTFTVQRYQVHVPVAAGPFAVGDVVDVTVSVSMPHLSGTSFRVAGLHEKSLQTAQRLLVDVLASERV